jgi:UDP-2,3-diacylglucosamine hydrolase
MIYFISDVHLGVEERKQDKIREDLLLRFLSNISDNCETLFIVGDLFDYWFEYKTVIPRYYYRTLTALHDMRKRGIGIEYVMGNHDFGHRDFFRDELDIPIFTDDIERTLYGRKFYISHGDGKAFNDNGYLLLKKVLRNPVSQKLFNLIHPDLGIRLASGTSRTSRSYTGKKDFGELEGQGNFARKKIDEGFDYVIMGHRHIAEMTPYGRGYYINLGEWIKEPTYAEFDGAQVRLRRVEEIL